MAYENDFEKLMKRAKWFKEDLDKADGWTQRYNVSNEYDSWSKTFPEEEVPIKSLFLFKNVPISIEKFAEMMHPSKMEIRTKWDKAFTGMKMPDSKLILFMILRILSLLINALLSSRYEALELPV